MKGKQELYECKICGEKFFLRTLKKHIKKEHNIEWKEYYDTYVDPTDHTCPICKERERVFSRDTYQKTCGDINCNHLYRSLHNGGNTKEAIEKAKQTKLERYGNPCFNNHEKSVKTCLEKYGTTNAGGTQESILKIKATKKERYGDENYCNPDKMKQSKLEKYGNSGFNNREQSKITCLEKYGVAHPGQIESGKIKGRITRIEKYGENNINNFEKQKKTLIELYGVENVSQIESAKQKRAETMLKKFGTTCNLSLPENRWFLNYPYEYDGQILYFDSIPEILFFQWHIEHNIPIKREPICIEYSIGDVKHTYIPDFEIDGTLYEIKRSDLIKDDWIILDFVDKKKELIEKSISMRENGVIIISDKDVYEHYFPQNGKDIISSVRAYRKKKTNIISYE